jgi:hypothetical protein
VDPTGKLAGRGAYLHNQRSCWERGLEGALARALKVDLSAQDIERLQAYLETLPEDENNLTEAGISQTGKNKSRQGTDGAC